jgi:WD40 repeat protein
VRLWDLTSGKQLAMADGHRDRVMSVACSPDGKLIATGSEDRSVRLWDALTLKELRQLKHHRGAIRAVTFSRDGKYLHSGGLDNRTVKWNVATGAVEIDRACAPCFGLAALPDGKRVLYAWRYSAMACLVKDGEGTVGALAGHTKQLVAVSVSGDGKQALTGSQDRSLRLWDITSLKCLFTLTGHTAEVNAVAMSPRGTYAVSGGHDKALRIWDLTTGRHVRELPGHAQAIWGVAISPDGKRALSGSQDGTMRLWSIGQ